MEKRQIKECLNTITSAMLDMENAKADYKLKVDSAILAHGFTKDQGKVMLQIAKAIVAGKLEEVERNTAELSDMIDVCRDIVTE